jgi:hypothetical protein
MIGLTFVNTLAMIVMKGYVTYRYRIYSGHSKGA